MSVSTVRVVMFAKSLVAEGRVRVPMIVRPVVSEPFESVVVDNVGALPPAIGKYQ